MKPGVKEFVAPMTVDEHSRRYYVYKLRFMVCMAVLGVLQHSASPSVPYMINSFFAAKYGGGHCEATPKSGPCRQGAVEAALYHGWTDALSNVFAMVLAVGLGSRSDHVGRLPLIRIYAVLTALPTLALSLNVIGGLTLWAYLILNPLVEVFDVNGVMLALMSDIVPNAKERANAFGAFLGVLMLVVGITSPFTYLLPKGITIVVGLAATVIKITYVFTVFPETAPNVVARAATPPGAIATAKLAARALTRNSFIIRMVGVLTLSALGSSGYAIAMPPFMTGYLGFTRKDKLVLGVLCLLSALVMFLYAVKPLVSRFGNMGALKISLAACVAFPILCPFCSNRFHFWMLCAVMAGPIILSLPVLSVIKGNLVAHDEQGLIQGAITSIGKGSASVGFLFFSYILIGYTHSGQEVSFASVWPAFLLIAGINLVALLLACSLPSEPPPPPRSSLSETLLGDEEEGLESSGPHLGG